MSDDSEEPWTYKYEHKLPVWKVVVGEHEDTLKLEEILHDNVLVVSAYDKWTAKYAGVKLTPGGVSDLIVALQEWLAKREGMG